MTLPRGARTLAQWLLLGGHNLVIDTVHEGDPQIPLRMAPMVLLGTVLTHLFGGSAGREGTAVQMGGSMADAIAHRLRVSPDIRREVARHLRFGARVRQVGIPDSQRAPQLGNDQSQLVIRGYQPVR